MEYKYFLSVCLSIKNEAKYIEEFIQHYIHQGVDHFYIINNNSDDNIEEVIKKSEYESYVTLITDNRDMKILRADEGALGHRKLLTDNLFPLIKEETEWAILIDADEFIYGRNGYTIKSYLGSLHENIGCLYVLWNIINPYKDENNNLIDDFSIKKNIKRINYDLIDKVPNIKKTHDFGKSVFRTKFLTHPDCLWLHLVKTYDCKTINNYGIEKDIISNWYDENNKVIYSEENFNKVNITLNHYAIRNSEDYEKKKSQLILVPHKTAFINSLFEMLELDDSLLVTDNYIAK